MSDANKETDQKEMRLESLPNTEKPDESNGDTANVQPAADSTSSPQNSYPPEDNEHPASSTTPNPYSGNPSPVDPTNSYSGFTYAEMMSIFLGLASPYCTSAGRGNVGRRDKAQTESSRPNLTRRTCYFRPLRRQTDRVRSSSLKTASPRTMSHAEFLRQKNLLLLLMSIEPPTSYQSTGPRITEIIDKEHYESNSPVPALQPTADPAMTSSFTKNKITWIQKTPYEQKNSVDRETDKSSTDTEKGDITENQKQIDDTVSVMESRNNDGELYESSMKSKLEGPLLRRKRNDPRQTDNRHEDLQEESRSSLSVPAEKSNVSRTFGRSRARSKAMETSSPVVDKAVEVNIPGPLLRSLHSDLSHYQDEVKERSEKNSRSDGRQTTTGIDSSKIEREGTISVATVKEPKKNDSDKPTNAKDYVLYGQAKSQLPDCLEIEECDGSLRETQAEYGKSPNRINQFFNFQRKTNSVDQFNKNVQNKTGSRSTINETHEQQVTDLSRSGIGDTAARPRSTCFDEDHSAQSEHRLDDQSGPGHRNDALSQNVQQNRTATEPSRNDNAAVNNAELTEKSNVTDESISVRAEPKICSPNFATSSYDEVQAKKSSSYQSDSAGSGGYQTQQSGGDRLSNLSEAMLEKGMTVKDVYSDGNCLFAAVVDQLRVRGEFYYTPNTLRQAAVQYLREHPNQADGTPLFEFVSNNDNLTWEGYLDCLNRDGEWADHIIISAISNLLRRRLVIYSIMRHSKQISKTVMEPDLRGMSRERDKPIKTEGNHGHPQSQARSPHNNSREPTGDDVESKEELLEDLHLGHIPEAHYVSLRYFDWKEKLYTALSKNEDDPSTHHTAFGGHKPARGSNDPSSDSNEGFDGPQARRPIRHLQNTHFNMLLKYLQDGNFLETSDFFTRWHRKFLCEFDDLYTITGSGDRFNQLESYLVTDNNVKTSYCDGKGDPVVWYTIVPNDTIVSQQGTEDGHKLLCPDETGCKLGYLKLRPVNPTVWRQYIGAENGKYYLKHLHFQTKTESSKNVPITVAFNCDWPEAALECKKNITELCIRADKGMNKMTQKVLKGVQVVPSCAESNTCIGIDCLEWKYSFSSIERVFCRRILTSNARFCFRIMEHFLRFVFCGKNVISRELQKSVFFYTCYELDIGNKDLDFFSIVSYFMFHLEACLKERNLPDFFFRPMNLIHHVDEKEISWHYERTCLVRNQCLVYMFIFLDQKGLFEHFNLSRCLDILLSDAYRVAPNPDECSKRLTVMVAREWVVAPAFNFRKANLLIEDFTSDVTCSEEEEVSEGDSCTDILVSTKLHKRVMKGIPLQEQWLYAFFLEIETGVPILEHVCNNLNCENLQNFFGESVMQILATDYKMKNPCIELPVNITEQEGIARFAVKFGEVLKTQVFNSSAYTAAIHFFLSRHTESLLDTFDNDQNNKESRVPFDAIVQPLIKLFYDLYNQYYYRQRESDFLNLMHSFERLCAYTQYAPDYELLASLWLFFGNKERAYTAMTNVISLRKDKNIA